MKPFHEAVEFKLAWDRLSPSDDNAENRMYIRRSDKIWQRKNREVQRLKTLRRQFGLPDGSILYEYVDLKRHGAPGRALAIWIEAPQVYLDAYGDAYGCPGDVEGKSKVCGQIRFSLLDVPRQNILNTLTNLDLHRFDSVGNDCLGLPLSLASKRTYHSDGRGENEGLVTILHLSDFNHDGVTAEFPLYEYAACGWVFVTLLGYLPREDRLEQLVFELQLSGKIVDENGVFVDSTDARSAYWMPNLPLSRLAQNRHLQYSFYGGHGMETTDFFDCRAIPATGHFEGIRKIDLADDVFGGKAPWIMGGRYHN